MANHNYLASDDMNPDFVGANNPDNRLTAEFHVKPVQNNFRSEQEGRPIYDDVEMVRINVPGDALTTIEAIVREDHKRRFSMQWAMFKNQNSGNQLLAGKTPLEHWSRLTPAQIAELKHLKFLSVEDIATASDTQLQAIGMCGGMSPFAFRDIAVRFLKLAADEAGSAKSDAALEAAKNENADLRAQMQAQAATMASFEARFAAMAAQTNAAPVEPAAEPDALAALANANAAKTGPQKRNPTA